MGVPDAHTNLEITFLLNGCVYTSRQDKRLRAASTVHMQPVQAAHGGSPNKLWCRDVTRQLFHINGGRTTAYKPEVLGSVWQGRQHTAQMPLLAPSMAGLQPDGTAQYPWAGMAAPTMWQVRRA